MLFKYSGKYVDIYFNMKITFLNNGGIYCTFIFRCGTGAVDVCTSLG